LVFARTCCIGRWTGKPGIRRPYRPKGWGMNVVESWRSRARQLRAQYRRCAACGALATVRRLSCTRCGADMSEAHLAPLPRSMPTVAFSHAHLVVETMDQVENVNGVMLARVNANQVMALPLCDSDAELGPRLVGEELGYALRREGSADDSRAPIVYRRKLAASP